MDEKKRGERENVMKKMTIVQESCGFGGSEGSEARSSTMIRESCMYHGIMFLFAYRFASGPMAMLGGRSLQGEQ